MHYPIHKIAEIISGQWVNTDIHDTKITHILFDSRKVVFPKTALFFAFPGKRADGHAYLNELYAKQVRNFVVSREIDIKKFPNANFIRVKNTLTSLQKLAIFHRNNFTLKTIGITGSNGKTIIKEWLFQLLHEDFNIVRSAKSYNSQIGVPLSVLKIEKEHELGIFEAGISTRGEMQKLQEIINCQIGIFTNIGPSHSAGFKNTEEKITEKLKLFKDTGTIIYCKDQEAVARQIEALPGKRKFDWSRRSNASLRITKEIFLEDGTTLIDGLFNYQKTVIRIPFQDHASLENAIHCWAVLLFLGFDPELINERMAELHQVAMRLELKEGINHCTLINDSYNSDLMSLQIALDFLEQQGSGLKRTLILSDILQSGKKTRQLYEEVAKLILEKKVERLIGIGKDISVIKTFLPSTVQSSFQQNTTKFLENFKYDDFQNEIILIKGARLFTFEKIVNRLARKSHKTVLEIDLDAVAHNLNVYRNLLKPKTKMMVMVKASAYGSGSNKLAKRLEFQKADYLAVAYADEGVELRKAGIRLPIMVLNPEEATFESLIRYKLEPEIYSIQLLEQLIAFLPDDVSLNIHLKLDTGMHRLGFEKTDLKKLYPLLLSNPNLNVKSIFSHLAASDDPQEDDFTESQIRLFQTLSDQIMERLKIQPIRHILNSNGIARFPQYQFDMVRLGIGLYGLDSSGTFGNELERVHTLKATISQIRTIKAHESIGYNRKGRVNKTRRIATISIGYADGLLRKAGNGNYQLLIHGKTAPTIGNICMDMCMLDISEIPEAQQGDEVIIFGKEHAVEKLAEALETIPYEVFTNLSERVKRSYFQE